MIGKKKIDERFISRAEVKDIILKRQESSELLYEQGTTLDIIQKFTKITSTQSKEMVSKLLEKIPRIREENAAKIVDLMPKDKEDLGVIFSKERFILTDEEISTILEIIDNYR
ncbi:MAG: RNA polymerase Rpb4 family protein [Candidatus Methanofastidiosia archaeon]